MTELELSLKINEIRTECDKAIQVAIINFCKENNPYKIGDVFTDHIGSVKIDKIGYFISERDPCCIYYGLELKKDGTPRKDLSRRGAYQSNEKSNP